MAAKTKVLYVFGGEKASGAEIVIGRLMSYNLAAVEPHLFISPGAFAHRLMSTASYQVVLIEQLKKLNRSSAGKVSFYLQALTNYFAVSRQVLRYVHQQKIEVVHANTVVPASYLIPAIFLASMRRQKIAWLWSDHDLSYYSKLDHVFSKVCCACYSKTLAVSEAVKKKYGNKPSVLVLYNGLDLSQFQRDNMKRSDFRKQFGFRDDCIVFGIAATISPRKGQLALIKVFAKLLNDYSSIHLVVAGTFAADSPAYNAEVQQALAHSEGTTYMGHIDDMAAFYNGCDVIINNSTAAGSEPLGTTIYEAMACEKIVIASRTGGTPEIIDDNKNGFLFTADSGQELLSAMEYIICNFATLLPVATAARAKAAGRFDIKVMADTYNAIVNEC